MDNRITKKRLSHFLSYEWIAIVAVIIVCVVLVEFFYSVAGVKLTTGQHFKVFYDQNIDYNNSDRLLNHLKDKNTFSFGVYQADSEEGKKEFNVIGYRVTASEGDIIITDDFLSTAEGASKYVRAKTLIDDISVYILDELLLDAKEYLKSFLTDENGDIYNTQDYSLEKIESNFRKRVKGDNFYRSEKAIVEGAKKEKQRIFRLIDEIKDFEVVLSLPSDYFFSYTKYEQAYNLTDGESNAALKENLERGFKAQSAQNRQKYGTPTARYGLRLDKLTSSVQGKLNNTEFFKMYDQSKADHTVALALNFKAAQPDLQYEEIFFLNQLVRSFSDILD